MMTLDYISDTCETKFIPAISSHINCLLRVILSYLITFSLSYSLIHAIPYIKFHIINKDFLTSIMTSSH